VRSIRLTCAGPGNSLSCRVKRRDRDPTPFFFSSVISALHNIASYRPRPHTSVCTLHSCDTGYSFPLTPRHAGACARARSRPSTRRLTFLRRAARLARLIACGFFRAGSLTRDARFHEYGIIERVGDRVARAALINFNSRVLAESRLQCAGWERGRSLERQAKQ